MDSQELQGLAATIDHTLLKPESTRDQVEQLCREALTWEVASVCISSSRVALVSDLLTDASIGVCTVVGFPSGATNSIAKQREAQAAADDGAQEFDMVLNIGGLKDGDHGIVAKDLQLVREAVPAPNILKVIIEAAALTDQEIVDACRLAADAGADFVKSSTGFHPSGGATIEAVRRMHRTVGPGLGVKASGGIRTFADAQAMLNAGATRLGLSGTVGILEEARSQGL